ncbi:MAG: hypothetical protein LQ338_006362 [Usnochroma carphineum]|nr:MAG: hypothetical protein LQ338_006362 [Usnochroma carphineum]
MKSLIISTVVGALALAIHGVEGAVIPVHAIQRYKPSGPTSETMEEPHSLVVKRLGGPCSSKGPNGVINCKPEGDGDDSTNDNHSTALENSSSSDVSATDLSSMSVTDSATASSTNDFSMSDLKKRAPIMKRNFPDLSKTCSGGYHWVKKPDPGYCWQVTEDHPPPELFNYCYAWVPCDQKTPKRDIVADKIANQMVQGGC